MQAVFLRVNKIQGGGGVKSVEPIKDKAVVNDIIDYLKLKSDRDAMLFTFGIYSGLRISDIIKLRVRDVRGQGQDNSKRNKDWQR